MRKLNLNRRECNKIINFIIKRMLRNRNKDIKEDQCFPQSKPQKLPQRGQKGQQNDPNPQKSQKENALHRLQYIRKKYSSKEKDSTLQVLEHTRSYLETEDHHPKEEVREQSKSYIRDSYRDSNKEPEMKGWRDSERERPVSRAPLEERVCKPQKQEYSYYKGVSRIQEPEEGDCSHNKSVGVFEPPSGGGSMMRSTSVYLGAREPRDKSAEQVSRRVENIDKINQKIKSLLSMMDTSSMPCQNISRPSMMEEKPRPQTSLKQKRTAYVESIPKNLNKTQVKKESAEDDPSPNSNIVTQLRTLQVENYDSQHLVDQSFVVQKYNPKSKQNTQKPLSNQIQDLMYKLSIQIQHDQNLRTCKYFFLLSTQPDKFQRLLHQLSSKGVKYSPQKLKEIMKFTEQQYNPFIYQSTHEDFGKFAEAIVTSTQYWQKNIYRKFSCEKLKSERIDQLLVFDNKEDELIVSDLVRFVNLGSGNLYKNRDLVLIARRMSSNVNELSVEKIMRAFCDMM